MKALKTGETKLIKVETFTQGLKLEVKAECVDMETPYIEIMLNGEEILLLTDADAYALIQSLQKALRILPSSK